MNHDGPRQKKDGTWGYTSMNDRDEFPHAIGYCTPFKEWSDASIAAVFGGSKERYETYIQPFRDMQEKFHDGGHATAEEACDCYKQYELDHHLEFSDGPENPTTLKKCSAEGCDKFTAGSAQITGKICGDHWPLCEEHRTREVVQKLHSVGSSWYS